MFMHLESLSLIIIGNAIKMISSSKAAGTKEGGGRGRGVGRAFNVSSKSPFEKNASGVHIYFCFIISLSYKYIVLKIHIHV